MNKKVDQLKISVIITSYNYEEFLAESISSVLQQTYPVYELIIVDDCSKDSSWEIICDFKKKYPNIVTVRHEYNWGDGVVIDAVTNYTTGDYIALQNSDDIWEPDKLEKQVKAIQDHEDCVAVFTNVMVINDNGEPYLEKSGFYHDLFSVENRSRQEWLRRFFYEGNCLCHPSVLIRKDVYMDDDFFRKGLRQIPDFVKWIQVCKKHEIYVLQDEKVRFRVHGNGRNASGLTKEKQIRSSVELFMMLDEYKNVTDKDEFLKIFPEAKDYCKEPFIPEYALGRICTQYNLQPYTRIYGMQLLYSVLNDVEKRKILKEIYSFTTVDFMAITGSQDIFGIIPEGYEQTRTLYFRYGEEYISDNSIQKPYVLGDDLAFNEEFVLDVTEDSIPSGLRFDPAEGVFLKIRINKVLINGIEFDMKPQNSLCTKENMDIFVTSDPIYHIEDRDTSLNDVLKAGKNIIQIEGMMARVSTAEVSELIMSYYYKTREKIHKTREKIHNLQKRVTDIESSVIYKVAMRLGVIKS